MDDTARRSAAAPAAGDGPFDAYYFEHCCGVPYRRNEHWLTFFGDIADRIVAGIQPRRVLDAGCAMGVLVETLRTRGVEAYGVDLSSYAIEHVYEPIRPFCWQGSIAKELTQEYDLIVSIEVLEHMPVRESEAAIANFCRHTGDVLFSSTPFDRREPSHINVQPPEYWAEQFARHGFYHDVDFDASFVTPWAVRFRRIRDPLPRIVRNYERRFAALAASDHDARSFSVDVQRELARALERLSAVESERDQLRGTLDAERDRARLMLDAERNQARQALDAERDRARQALDAERAALHRTTQQLGDLGAALDETHAQLTRKVVALDDAHARLTSKGVALEALEARGVALQHDLLLARETIRLMQQSAFWRLRGLWAAVSRALGRPT